jgi:hypothetical protein
MSPAPSPVDGVHSLISAFGASFAPGDTAPPYEVSLGGPRIRLTTSRGVLEEHASEWKRLCGRLWVQALPDDRARALDVLLPTLSDFDGAVWAPMQRLLEADAVASALRTLEASLPDALEALACRIRGLSRCAGAARRRADRAFAGSRAGSSGQRSSSPPR